MKEGLIPSNSTLGFTIDLGCLFKDHGTQDCSLKTGILGSEPPGEVGVASTRMGWWSLSIKEASHLEENVITFLCDLGRSLVPSTGCAIA